MSATYRLNGLNVRSEVPLDERALVRDRVDPDIEVRLGEPRSVPDDPGEGALFLRLEVGSHISTLVRTSDVALLRYPGLSDCEIAPDGRSVRVHLDPQASDEWGPTVVAGNTLSVILTLWGEAVLHASAVDLGGSALAFLGPSGVGKSTVAALMCAHGARIVSDDLLRVVVEDGRAWCFAGATTLRLRSHAAELSASFPPESVRRTFDGRVGLAAPRTPHDRLPLSALVVPHPSRELTTVRVERIPASDGMFQMIRYPRTFGWLVDEPLRSHFQRLGEIARVVPVYRAGLPWGMPFEPRLVSELLSGIGLESALSPRS